MAAIKSLCKTIIVLDKGIVKFHGDPTEGISYYLNGAGDFRNRRVFESMYNKEKFTLHEISLNPRGKTSDDALDEYQEIELNALVTIKNDSERLNLTYVMSSETGEPIFTISHIGANKKLFNGLNHIKCFFPKGYLNIGTYYLSVYIIEDAKNGIFFEKDIMSFNVQIAFWEEALNMI